MVVHRREMKATLARVLRVLTSGRPHRM
jgi:hypothetical protein